MFIFHVLNKHVFNNKCNYVVLKKGMFVVSLPYAVANGGYWALFAMIIVAYVCCYTGKILVDCLYDDDDDEQVNFLFFFKISISRRRRRIRASYVDIAKVNKTIIFHLFLPLFYLYNK